VTPVQGTLSSVLKNTGLSIDDFPLGDQPDVLAFVPIGSEEDIIVFARGLALCGLMHLGYILLLKRS